jgi:5-(carboxyamino)imidazole ribonucleotide synthase
MILPPATIGVLGGGQLGRYTLMAARAMGYRTAVLDPDPAAPAGAVADSFLVAPFDDDLALRSLGAMSAVVTAEFENPPVDSLRLLSGHTCLRPSPDAISVAQDRRHEKRFLTGQGFPVAPFVVVETEADTVPQLQPGPVLDRRRLTVDRPHRRAGDPEDRPARIRRQGPGRRHLAARPRRRMASPRRRAVRPRTATAARA